MEQNQKATTPQRDILIGFDQRFKILELSANLFDRECDRMWKRYSAMLTANMIFVAILGFQRNNVSSLILLSTGILGFVLCFCWFMIMVISRYYEVRWQKDMNAIIESDPNLKEYLRGRSRETSRIPRPFSQSSSFFAMIVILAFAALWVGVFIFGLVSISWNI